MLLMPLPIDCSVPLLRKMALKLNLNSDGLIWAVGLA
jgi:hypothetical protein